MVRIDWNRVNTDDKPKYEPIPPGHYNAEVFEAITSTSKSNNPMIVLTVRLTDDPYEGRRLTSYYPILENSLWKLKNLLISCGFSEEELSGEEEFDPALLVGEEVMVEVTSEVYDGKERNGVKTVKGLRAGREAGSQALQQFAATANGARDTQPALAGAGTKARPFAGPAKGKRDDFLGDGEDLPF